MITYLNVMTWISIVVTIISAVWLLGLLVFVIVKKVIDKVKQKKQMKSDLEGYENSKKRKLGA